MIDLHSHLLPGIDDGPKNLDASLAMARVAVDAGIREMACTPHMSQQFPTPVEWMQDALQEMQTALDAEGIPLKLHPGGEIRLDFFSSMSDDDLVGASLGGSGRWILLELPVDGWPLELSRILDGLAARGMGAVLAHPERYPAVQRVPDRLWDAVGRGALCQLNASSFHGFHGDRARSTAQKLAMSGLCHLLASDGHSADRRPPGMAQGLEAVAMALRSTPEKLNDLVVDVPARIVAGKSVSPSPRTPPQPHPEPAGQDSREES